MYIKKIEDKDVHTPDGETIWTWIEITVVSSEEDAIRLHIGDIEQIKQKEKEEEKQWKNTN